MKLELDIEYANVVDDNYCCSVYFHLNNLLVEAPVGCVQTGYNCVNIRVYKPIHETFEFLHQLGVEIYEAWGSNFAKIDIPEHMRYKLTDLKSVPS